MACHLPRLPLRLAECPELNRTILIYVAKAFGRVLVSLPLLVVVRAAFSGVLVAIADIDPLTAYLATSPGGADSVAIIAASTKVDMPFVMAMQTGRFTLVLLTGPVIARLLAIDARAYGDAAVSLTSQ
jgi:uncharacterized protein